MTTLVTGASGFVGAAVVRLLLAEGFKVRVLVRPSSDRRNVAGLPVEVVTGDLRDARSLAGAVNGCSSLFHVAADYRLWSPRPRELYDSNVEGTRKLMQAALAAGVERIVYTSSVATLGINKDGTPASEETFVTEANMIGHYKRSKFLAEQVVREMVSAQRLPVVIVNPSTPIGPRDVRPTPTGALIRDAALGKMPAYVDTGLNIVHVDDVATGHLLAFRRGRIGERYILGGEDLRLREILARIAALTHRKPPTIQLQQSWLMPLAYLTQAAAHAVNLVKPWEPQLTVDGLKMSRKLMFFSSDKARRELGYAPRPAGVALADAVHWFLHEANK